MQKYDKDFEKNKIQYKGLIAIEDQFSKDYYRENAKRKANEYENIRKAIKHNDLYRKEIRDYYEMNNNLIREFN